MGLGGLAVFGAVVAVTALIGGLAAGGAASTTTGSSPGRSGARRRFVPGRAGSRSPRVPVNRTGGREIHRCSERTLRVPLAGCSRKDVHMGTDDKIDAKADEFKGKAKEAAGRATDDPDLEAEGKGDQAKGDLKQAGEKVKDAFKR
jgi:uncharacterized protein YjbJ (UPF0337 family)